MRGRTALLSLFWSCQLWANDAQVSLVDVYDASRVNDPTYQVADHDYQASRQEEAIGRSGLLPQVGVNSRYGRSALLGKKASNSQSDQFASDSVALSINQPLYDKGRWASFEEGKARGRLGEVQFDGASQGLFDRVVETYFDVAQVENELQLTTQQKASIEGLAKQSKRLFEAGEAAKTDIEEAQARLDLVRAQEIELQARHVAALRKLSGRAGIAVGDIPQMQELPPQSLLAPEQDLDYWMDKARQGSPTLESKRAAIQLAEANLEQQRAGHYPTLALTSQVAQIGQSDLNQYSQRQSSYYVGVVIDIPIYQGGGVSASTARAHSALDSAHSGYDAESQQMAEDIEAAYLGVVAGLEKTKALATAVRSNRSALESAEKGYQAGVRSTVEILDAQQRLYAAKRDLLNSKLAMLLSYVNLHTRTGLMTRAELQKVQGLF
jgi:protease secretion system outer membrane protein